MLQNVKDQNGNPYINADGTGNFSILTESGKIDFSGNTGFDYLTGDAVYNQEQLQQTAEQVTPGTIELNAVSARDQRSRDYMRETLTGDKYGLANEDVDALFDILDAVLKRVENIAKEFPTMKAWQERDINDPDLLYRIFKEEYKSTFGAIPTRSSFKKNGDYELNFDFGTLCTKRESMDLIMQLLSDEGYVQNLGPTQIEALKSLLKENGFLTACDICFVESKRVRALNDANKFAFEWKSVLLAVGINDDYEVGYNRELTPEQFNKLMELADKNNKEAYAKYVPEERKRVKVNDTDLDTGITADKAKKIAQLMLQDSVLAGNFRPEWLLTTRGTDWLVRSFAHTNLANTLAAMFGAATAKPLEGFNIYDALSWARDFDSKKINMEHVWSIGGFRAQSFTDFNPLLFVDYVQMFIDLEARGLPLHTYTKVPALVELFGETGAMINMSLVPAIVQGATKENAGLKKDENGNWLYAWAKESFPVEEAMTLRKEPRFGGRVGTIAVGVSDMQILMMLDDPNIDMIIPYHASGMPAAVKLKTGLNVAKNYESEQNTKTGYEEVYEEVAETEEAEEAESKKKKGKKKKDEFSYNRTLQKLKDPRKAAQAYLDYCEAKGFTPKFATFKDHPNYYKLLEDFRGYDNDGNPVIQQPVRLKLPENWEQILREALGDRTQQNAKSAAMKSNKELMDKARKIVSVQRLDGEIREVFMRRLKGALGSANVTSLKNADFLNSLQAEYTSSLGEEAAASKIEIYRKGDGIVYGYAKNGKIYLNENYFNANTPAHEFTHIWAKVAQTQNPELWDKGKSLLKESEEWQEVLNDPLYADIIGDENAVASEVLARIVGKENEEYIRSLIDPTYKMAKGAGLKNKIMAWVQEMFKSIRSLFDNADNLTYDEFVHMPLKALWDTSGHKRFSSNIAGAYKKKPMTMAEIMAERQRLNEPSDTENKTLSKDDILLKIDKVGIDGLTSGSLTETQIENIINRSNEKIFQWAMHKVNELGEKVITDPLGNEIKFQPGEYETIETYVLHMLAGKGKGVDDIHGRRAIALELLESTIRNPLAIITSEKRDVDGTILRGEAGNKQYIAIYKSKYYTGGNVIVSASEDDNGRIVTSFAAEGDKKHKNKALKELKKSLSAAVEIHYLGAGLSGHPRPATEQRVSQGDVSLHPSGTFTVSESTENVNSGNSGNGYYQEKATTTKGFFNPTEGIIGLFKGADASTVIHEGGHFFVENLINDVLSGDCTQQQQQDAAALMDYCGITLEQWQSMSVEERRQYHEKLAEEKAAA